MNAAELITKAADLIEQTGWSQKCNARDAQGKHVMVYDPRATCFCAYGAMAKTMEDIPERQLLLDIAANALNDYVVREFGEPEGGSGQNIVNYNDTPGRTKEEVLAVMRATAKELSA